VGGVSKPLVVVLLMAGAILGYAVAKRPQKPEPLTMVPGTEVPIEPEKVTIGIDKADDNNLARSFCKYIVCRTKPEYMVERLEDGTEVEFQENPACHDVSLVDISKAQGRLVLKIGIGPKDLNWDQSSWSFGIVSANGNDMVGGDFHDIHDALKQICNLAKGTGGKIETTPN
jgi:hypothetical protein